MISSLLAGPGRLVLALAFAAVVLLTGCPEQPMITDTYVGTAYTQNEFGRGAARRDLKTEIRGDPFDQGSSALARRVTGLLTEREPGPQPTTFTTAPGDSVNPPYRVILLFDAPRAVNALSVCREPPAPEAAPAGTVRLTGAFCRGTTTLTKASGEVHELTGPADPDFEHLIVQVAQQLFPLQGLDRD